MLYERWSLSCRKGSPEIKEEVKKGQDSCQDHLGFRRTRRWQAMSVLTLGDSAAIVSRSN